MKLFILSFIFFMTNTQMLTGGYEIGATVKDFTLKNAIDQKQISLKDYSNKKVVVIVFTCNHCPYAKLYEDRLVALSTQFMAKNVAFLAINPNDPKSYPDDGEKEMVARAKAKNFNFPYLINNDQSVSDLFGASKTPEVFVLDKSNGGFVLRYKGAIDDNPQTADDVTEHYLEHAIESVLGGKSIEKPYIKATGCSIKRKG